MSREGSLTNPSLGRWLFFPSDVANDSGNIDIEAAPTAPIFKNFLLSIVLKFSTDLLEDPLDLAVALGQPGLDHLIFRFEPELRTGRAFHNTLHLTRNALSYVMTVLRKMETEFANTAPGCEAAAASALLELIVLLSRASREKKADKSVSRLAGLFCTLEASFREEWTLARMAKYASMSVNTLLRTFRAAAKQTPIHYLNSLRLNAASLLLLDSDRSISEIAFSCGFSDSNYFTKKFRNAFGITPGAFRKKHREESR